jgi:hypothetical protein
VRCRVNDSPSVPSIPQPGFTLSSLRLIDIV